MYASSSDYSAWIWLLLNFITIAVLAFYSMMEMASVSFNPVRLQYYVSRGVKQAIWLNYLLHNPSRLFGTTLFLVNITTFSGSEFARKFFEGLGINPDFSVPIQVLLVVIFGELAPMFAARRYSEDVVRLGMPLLYFTAKLMAPFLWLLGIFSNAFNFLIGGKKSDVSYFLSQEELLKILESQETGKSVFGERKEYDTVAANIFNLNKKQAKEIMNPLKKEFLIASNATIAQARSSFEKTKTTYLIMYSDKPENILGILYPRNLIRASKTKKSRDFIEPPWFVTKSTKALDLLNQFRTNNQNVTIVLDKKGLSCGIINLDDLMEEIFGETRHTLETNPDKEESQFILERTFSGTLTLQEFKNRYDFNLDDDLDQTLSELVKKHLGSHPGVGDSVFIGPFEITVEETSFTDVKSVSIHTVK